MKLIARIMLVIFAVVAVSGHGVAKPIVYHDHDHVHHHSDDHASGELGGHDHKAAVVVHLSVEPGPTDPFCANGCDMPDSDHSSAHFHIPCCGAFMALLTSDFGIESLSVLAADHPIGRSTLALGELRYPLLRPPRQLR